MRAQAAGGRAVCCRERTQRPRAVQCAADAAARTLVRALFELLVVGSLLDDVEDRDRQVGVREREGLGVRSVRLCAHERGGTGRQR